jgi:hypothetical protein
MNHSQKIYQCYIIYIIRFRNCSDKSIATEHCSSAKYVQTRLLKFVTLFLLLACQHVSARLPLDGYPWNLILDTFVKVSRGSTNWVKIWQKSDILFEDLYTTQFLHKVIVVQYSIFLYCCHCRVAKRHRNNALFLFHCNKVTRTPFNVTLYARLYFFIAK